MKLRVFGGSRNGNIVDYDVKASDRFSVPEKPKVAHRTEHEVYDFADLPEYETYERRILQFFYRRDGKPRRVEVVGLFHSKLHPNDATRMAQDEVWDLPWGSWKVEAVTEVVVDDTGATKQFPIIEGLFKGMMGMG